MQKGLTGPCCRAYCRCNHQVVWPSGTNPPIVCMGLLDTAGAAGVPRIDGVGIKPLTYDYVPMRDFAVSSEVQHVFQACSTQDRYVGGCHRVCGALVIGPYVLAICHASCNSVWLSTLPRYHFTCLLLVANTGSRPSRRASYAARSSTHARAQTSA